jgi:myosin tail region-interacting protein MTI1
MIRFVFILFFATAFLNTSAQQEAVAKKVLAYCDANKGKKVGKGECWDLAKEALNSAGATWTPPFAFGKTLGKKEQLKAGDILQFEKVRIEYPDGAWKELPHHTAIVYAAEGTKLTIAEQNANGKRFVIFSEIDLSYVKKGKYTAYRPQ